MTLRRTPTHLLQLFEVFFRGKELLTRELFLEWSEGFDAVRLEKTLGVRALRRFLRDSLRALLVKPEVESHLSHGIKGDAGFSCSGIRKGERHRAVGLFFGVEVMCEVCERLRRL